MNTDDNKKRKRGDDAFQQLGTAFDDYQIPQSKGYITREFQDYGYRLAIDLNDLEHKALYIRMAKHEDRGLLERARSFVIDAEYARSKAKMFMWKFKQLKEEKEEKEAAKAPSQESLFGE